MASLVYANDERKSYRAVRVLPGQWVGTWRRKMMTGVHYRMSTMQVVAKRTALIPVQVLAQALAQALAQTDLGPSLT
jgi:hypothetical protein